MNTGFEVLQPEIAEGGTNYAKDKELTEKWQWTELVDELFRGEKYSVLAEKLVAQALKGYYVVDRVLYCKSGDVTGRRRLATQVLSEHYEAMLLALKKMYSWFSQCYQTRNEGCFPQGLRAMCFHTGLGTTEETSPAFGEPFEYLGMV